MIDQLGVILTTKCNLKCKYCYYNSGIYPTQKMNMDFSKFISFFDRLTKKNSLGQILITGGEPIIVNYLLDLIQYVSSKVSRIMLLTNGTLITKELLREFIEYNVKLEISLDSVKKDYSNHFRGKHEELLEALNLIINSNYTNNVTLNTTISPGNIHEIKDIIDYSNEYGFNLNLNLMDSDDSLSWGKASIDKKNKMLKILQDYYADEENQYHYKLAKFTLSNTNRRVSKCLFSQRSLIVDTDGKIYPCFHNKLSLGEINNEIDEILENHSIFQRKCQNQFDCYRTACYSLF